MRWHLIGNTTNLKSDVDIDIEVEANSPTEASVIARASLDFTPEVNIVWTIIKEIPNE